MELDRHFIERNDFGVARRGYDPDEVDRHLREIADAIAPEPISVPIVAKNNVTKRVRNASERSTVAGRWR